MVDILKRKLLNPVKYIMAQIFAYPAAAIAAVFPAVTPKYRASIAITTSMKPLWMM